jgi:hypothetical protein
MKIYGLLVVVGLALAGIAVADDGPRMNQVQVIGTHNSYHIAPSPTLIKAAMMFDKGAAGWDYTHPPLPTQLDAGVRNFEIDLNYTQDKIHVFHVPQLDQGSTCPLFRECLANVVAWSKEHPNHLPITLLLEIKDDYAAWHKGMSAWDAGKLAQLDAEVREMVPENQLITPDLVRGSHPTLEAAVLAGNWPLLTDARGKIMLAIHDDERLRDLYIEGAPSLEGRACFIRSEPGRPYSAFIVADGPENPRIPEWVKAGYYVRTRADSGVKRAGKDGGVRLKAAFASGAQILSTDFPPGHPDEKTGYTVSFEGKGFRCNPVNHAEACPTLEP